MHSAVVELIALKNAHIRYTTIQNWSNNVYNLVTKRAIAYENATVEWVDGNFGSKVTMKYPCVILKGQMQKRKLFLLRLQVKISIKMREAKVIHLAPNTSSHIVSKSISKDGGRSSYRGF